MPSLVLGRFGMPSALRQVGDEVMPERVEVEDSSRFIFKVQEV
ncbi:MAG: hypothetical protein O2857_13695 [Planctomycetota bacterium]|nr:hypothetical protein [Planctomycetota bacterium]